jgi:hypothetical protein
VAEQARQVRIKSGKITVGADAMGALQIASANFDGSVYDVVFAALIALQQTGEAFPNIQAVVDAVMRNERAAAAVERARAEAEARRKVVYSCEIQRRTVHITQSDINHGRWERVEFRSDGSQRQQPDYGLSLTVDGMKISFHIHPPHFDGREPTPGGFAAPGQDPGRVQTPSELMPIILRAKGWPPEWGKNAYAGEDK